VAKLALHSPVAGRRRLLGGLRQTQPTSHHRRPNPTAHREGVPCLVVGWSFRGEHGVRLGERKVTSVDDLVRPDEIAPDGNLPHAGKKHLRRIVID
jgi:hypothetical protein